MRASAPTIAGGNPLNYPNLLRRYKTALIDNDREGVIKISEYVQARKSQMYYYRNVPLYNKVDDKKFVLYKPSGITIGEMRISEQRHPEIF